MPWKTSDQVAFDPFSTLAGVMSGQPFKILPTGTFYRGEREIVITEDDLRQIETNVSAGLPRYRIPINADHKNDEGKIGNVHEVKFMADGPDGSGLYATKYDLTDKGKKLVSEDGYDAPSAEMVWTKNDGQKYQDPFTGEYHDMILCGVAFTPAPFFGHKNVSLYSNKPTNSENITIAPTTTDTKKGNTMPDEKPVTPAVTVADTFDAKAKVDELTAALNTQKESFNAALAIAKAEADEAKTKAETFAAQFVAERNLREMNDLRAEAQTFATNLPVSVDEYAANFQALNKVSPELAKWFREKFALMDTAIATGGLFSQVSRTNAQPAAADNIDSLARKIVTEEFSGNMSKYADAVILAGTRRPDLVPAEMRNRPVRSGTKE